MRWLVFLLCFLLIISPAGAEVTGKYRVTYTDVTQLTDTLQLDFADTIANATVTFTAKGSANFDNSGGGYWQKANRFTFAAATTEYAQYRIEVNGTVWELYNVTGWLEASLTDADFWTLVNSTGADIRVFNDSKTQLYFWIESWDYTNQTATIWVNLTAGSTELNIAYGNPSASQSSYMNATKTFEFFDDFETWQGWTQYGSGVVSQSTAYVKQGQYSLKKDTNPDPNGGYKAIGKTLGRNIILEAWILRELNSGANADRIGVIDDNGNGYGFGKEDYGDKIWIDKRSSYSATASSSVTAVTTNKYWYLCQLIITDTQVTAQVVDDTGQLRKITITDTTYSTFTRVYVFGGYPYYVDLMKIYKLADPADVSSTEHYDLSVQNPRLILNGNTVQYTGDLPIGQSVTLAVNSTYFVQGANNVTITSDNLTSDNLAVMDVVLEFDYAFSVSTTVVDKTNYIWKNSTVTIPAGTVSATFSQLFPQRANDYRITVLKDGASTSYTSSADGTNIKISIDLTEGTYDIDEKVAYLVVNITAKDEETLSTLSTFNVTVKEKKFSTSSGYIKIYGDEVDTADVVRILIDAADYGERGYIVDFSNFDQQLTAYLLKTLSGSRITFTVMNPYGTTIVNAKVTARKLLEGTYAVVDVGLTDFAGSISLFLKPYDTYQISVSADGYSPVSYEIEINKLDYYVYLGSGITVDWSKVNTNVYYSLEPRFIDPNANTTIVNFTIYSKDNNLEYATLTLKYNGTVLFTDTITSPSGGQIRADITSAVANATSGFVIAEVEYKVGGQVFSFTRTIYIMGTTGLFPTLKNFQLEGFAKILVACFSTLIIVALLARVVPGFGTGIVALAILGFFTLAGWFDPWLYMLAAMVVIAVYVIMR